MIVESVKATVVRLQTMLRGNCLGPRGVATRDCTGKSDFWCDHAEEVTDDSEGNVVRSRLSWGLLLLFFGR